MQEIKKEISALSSIPAFFATFCLTKNLRGGFVIAYNQGIKNEILISNRISLI